MKAHRYAALFILAWSAISRESDATIFAKKFKRSIINPKEVSNLHPRRLVIKCCASGNSYDDLIDNPLDNGNGAIITADYESERNPGESTVSPQASLIKDIKSVRFKINFFLAYVTLRQFHRTEISVLKTSEIHR